MKKLWKSVYDNLEAYLGALLLVVMLVDLTIQVVARYIFGFTYPWSEEIARYLFVWLIFIGTSYAAKTGDHIRLDFLIALWPKHIRKYMEFVGDIIFIFYACIICYFGWKYMLRIFATNQFGPGTMIQMGYIYAAIPIGYILMIIRLVIRVIQTLKNKLEPSADHADEKSPETNEA